MIRARFLNTGLLSYSIASSDGGELEFGLGASIQMRKYLAHKIQKGIYLGGGLEIMYTSKTYDDSFILDTETYFIIPQVEGGYRWDSNGYFSAIGLFAGTAIPVNTVGYTGGENLPTGGLIWDIGWYF